MNIVGIDPEIAEQMRMLSLYSGLTLGQTVGLLMRRWIADNETLWSEIVDRDAQFAAHR